MTRFPSARAPAMAPPPAVSAAGIDGGASGAPNLVARKKGLDEWQVALDEAAFARQQLGLLLQCHLRQVHRRGWGAGAAWGWERESGAPSHA